MALFNFLFKDKAAKETDKKAKASQTNATARPAAATATATAKQTSTVKPMAAPRPAPVAPAPFAAPPKQATSPSDLDALMSVLQQIEEVIDDGAEADTQTTTRGKGTSVSLPISDMMKFAPSLLDKSVSAGTDERANVIIEDLYNKLARGKVTTTVQNFLHDVPRQYVTSGALDKPDALVSIPLPMIVAALDPVELKKRTSSVQKDFGADSIPNLFVSERKKAQATAAAAAPQKPSAPEKPKEAPKAPVAETPQPEPAAPVPEPKAVAPEKPIVPSAVEEQPAQPAAQSQVVPPKTTAAAPLRLRKDIETPAPTAAPVAEAPKAPTPAPKPQPVAEAPKAPPPAPEPKPQPVAEAPKAPPAPAPKPQPAAEAPKTPPAPPPKPQPVAEAPKAPPAPPPKPQPVAEAPKAPPAPPPKPQPVAEAPKAPPAPPPKPQPVAEAPKAPPPIMAPGKFTDLLFGFGKEPTAPAPETPKPVAAEPPQPAVAPPTPRVVPKPEAAAPVVPKPTPTRVPIPMATALPEKPAPAAPAPEPAAPAAPAIAGTGRVLPLMHRGIDLNSASAKEILSHMEGIGDAMAERIVEDRAENGPFYALYDLARVPGVGAKFFEKMTGWKWHEDTYGQLNIVNLVLDKWDGGLPNLDSVTARFQTLTGFEGCVILHRDGHLLASSWNPKSSQALEAMGPQIVKRTAQYMKSVCVGETMSVTVFMENRVVAFAEHGDVIFVGIRSPRAFNRRHLQIVHGMAMALGKRFSGLRDA